MTDTAGRPALLHLKRRMFFCALASAVSVGSEAATPSSPAFVMVIPSLHKLLAGNPLYTYADLYSLVAAFQPDRVGVEIRQEDLGRPDSYLHRNYPEEMVVLARKYGRRTFGFDWLGFELQGRPVPDDWWQTQSQIKRLERAWNAHPPTLSPAMDRLKAQMNVLSSQQDQIIKTATAASLADGRYDNVTQSYYRTMADLMRGTPFAVLPRWYAERDRQISANIVGQILKNPGRRIAIVTGCDHHGPITAAISALGTRAVIVPVHQGP